MTSKLLACSACEDTCGGVELTSFNMLRFAAPVRVISPSTNREELHLSSLNQTGSVDIKNSRTVTFRRLKGVVAAL